MKKNVVILTVFALFVLGACTASVEEPEDEFQAVHSMEDMPCHQMPDGSWMGDCSDDEMQEQNEPHSTMGGGDFLPGRELSESDMARVPPVNKSQEHVINDGETFNISADFVRKNISGEEIVGYGYNGMIPGPLLRVQQGSTVFVEFENNIDLDTTVHWHGLRHNILFDGVPNVSQEPVSPGESFMYELYFPDEGIFWYHPHIREDIQQESGLYGAIIVEPEEEYAPVNHEEVLVFDDILLDQTNNMVPFGDEHTNFAMMGRFGNTMLVNKEETYDLEIEQGSVVRFYLLNVANARPFNISIEGAQLKLVGGDLGLYEQESFTDSVIISPAERYIVEAYFPEQGEHVMKNVNPHKEYDLGVVSVVAEEASNDYSERFLEEKPNQGVIDDISQFEEFFDKEVDYTINLDLHMDMGAMDSMPCHRMGSMVMGQCSPQERAALEEEAGHVDPIEWEDDMNMRMSGSMVRWILEDDKTGEQNMDFVMRAEVGDVLKIRLFNDPESMHPMHHPIHLHGQRFLVTHIDGEPVENKVWKDTVLVPVGATVDILVDVTNPGEWMMHCHIAEHLEAGMMASLLVEE